MDIQFENVSAKREIVAYISGKQSNPEQFCHLCPSDRDGILKDLERLFAKPEPCVLGIRDEAGTLQGVFQLLFIPDERYIETDWGFANSETVYDALMSHLRSTYPGYHLDAIVTKSNRTMLEAYRRNGLTYREEQILMALEEYTPKPVQAHIIRYRSEYEASYRAIHDDKELYWTAERMLQALDRHDVFLAVENGAAVGYIEMTATDDENEPIQLFVKPECRGKGYGRALLQAAIEHNFPKKTVLEVYASNTPALNLYLSLGFCERLREYLGSMTL